MNLLSLLMGSMTSNASLGAMSQKTGQSSSAIKKLMIAAIPILIVYMTKNAKSKAGAQSLAGALTQHTNTGNMSNQIASADVEDGSKIIGHILGDDAASVINNLSAQTGMSQDDVAKVLAAMAPSMMSGLSAAATSASKAKASRPQVNLSDGLDMSDLMAMFGGQQAQPQVQQSKQAAGLSGLLGGLLGGQQAQPQKKQGVDLSDGIGLDDIMALMGGGSQSASSGAANLSGLASLLGGTSRQQQKSAVDGSDLLKALTGLL